MVATRGFLAVCLGLTAAGCGELVERECTIRIPAGSIVTDGWQSCYVDSWSSPLSVSTSDGDRSVRFELATAEPSLGDIYMDVWIDYQGQESIGSGRSYSETCRASVLSWESIGTHWGNTVYRLDATFRCPGQPSSGLRDGEPWTRDPFEGDFTITYHTGLL